MVVSTPAVDLPLAEVVSEVVGAEQSVAAQATPDALSEDAVGLTEPVWTELVDTAFGDEPWIGNAGTGRPDLRLEGLEGADEGDTVSVQVLPREGEDFIPGAVVAYRLRDLASGGAEPSWAGFTVDYGDFANAYGADYGGRLQLMVFPECALTTPEFPECVTGLPLTTTHHEDDQTLSAIVPIESPAAAGEVGSIGFRVAGGASSIPDLLNNLGQSSLASDGSFGGGSIIAAVSGASSDTGTFTQTKVEADGSWGVSEQTGAFTYSLPFEPVPASAGPSPSLALTYNSGAVDGMSVATNSQSGWAGSGWSLSTPYIERLYRNCGKDGFTARATELCWHSPYAGDEAHAGYVMYFNGVTQDLVWDASTDRYRLAEDDGTRVTRKTGASNADNDGEYFYVQTPDGSIYMFGYGQDAVGGGATNSVASVPVYGDDTGEPRCGGTAQADYCVQGYRWMLDRIIDPNENGSAYYYTREQNRYARAGNPSLSTDYTAAIYPKEIRYDYAADAGPLTALGRVLFTTNARCIEGAKSSVSPFATPAAPAGPCPTRSVANAAEYPDTPMDLWCTATCTSAQNTPAFFTTQRLDTVQTQYIRTPSGTRTWTSATTYQPRYLLPATSTNAPRALWLEDIQTKSYGASTSSSDDMLDFVTDFNPIELKSRVDWADDTKAFKHLRIARVTTSLGARIDVDYKLSGENFCPVGGTGWSGYAAWFAPLDGHWDTNTKECYKVKFDPDGSGSQPAEWGIFHKYLVERTTVDNIGGGAPARVTTYNYVGEPRWAYQNSFVFAQGTGDQHWNSWRGYGTVEVTTGSGPDKVTTRNQYFRGLDNDYRQSGDSANVTITPIYGGTPVADSSYLAGQLLASQTLDSHGALQAATHYKYEAPTQITGVFMHYSVDTRVKVASSYTRTDETLALRQATTTYTYDPVGRVEKEAFDPDADHPGLESCTATSYIEHVTNTADAEATTENKYAWGGRQYLWRPDTVTTFDGPCPTTTTSTAVTGKIQYRYDNGSAFAGSGWETWLNDGNATAEYSFAQADTALITDDPLMSNARYDSRGRIAKAWLPTRVITQDPSMAWAYTREDSGRTRVVATPVGDDDFASTSWIEPVRGNAVKSQGANGLYTHRTYDALGRLTAAWSPTDYGAAATPTTLEDATATFAYGAAATPTEVATSLVRVARTDRPGVADGGGNQTSYTFLNRLGEAFQTQSARRDGVTPGQLVSHTDFTDRGFVATTTTNQVRATGAPGATALVPEHATVSSYTAYSYDFAGRVVAQSLSGTKDGVVGLTILQETLSTYEGDTTKVTAPTGAVTTTTTDILGRVVSSELGPETGGTGSHLTQYEYETLTDGSTTETVTDPDGRKTIFTADWLGRRTSVVDANAGTSNYTYNADGTVHSIDSAAGWVTMAYDDLGRTVARKTSATESGAALSTTTWTFDTLSEPLTLRGQLMRTSTTTGTGGDAYTHTTEVSGIDAAKQRATKSKVKLPGLDSLGAFKNGVYETTVGYDDMNRAASLTWSPVGSAAAETATTTYDEFGLPLSLKSSDTTVNLLMSEVKRTADGLLASRTLANDVTRSIEWDPTYRTPNLVLATRPSTGPVPEVLQRDTYTRDSVGRVTGISDQVAGVRQCFDYDAYNRLAAAWTMSAACTAVAPTDASWDVGTSAYTARWTYTSAGSIDGTVGARHGVASTTEDYVYGDTSSPAAVTQTTSTAEGAYVYDAAGRMTKRLGQTLTWDVLSNLTRVAPSTGDATSYLYDASGQRYAAIKGTTATIYMGSWEASDPTTGNPAGADVTVTRIYTADGAQLASKTTGGELTVALGDVQGSAQVAVPETGTVKRNAYTPYGAKRDTADPIAPGRGWLNQIADTDTGLTYLNARYYDPVLGRFLSPDPLLNPNDPRTLDPYRYADNNPVVYTDANGLNPSCGAYSAATAVCWSSYAGESATDPATKAAHKTLVQNSKGEISRPAGGACMGMLAQCRAIDIWNETMPFTPITLGKADAYNRLLSVKLSPEIHVPSVLEDLGATVGLTAYEFFAGDVDRCIGGDAGSCGYAALGMIPGLGKVAKVGKVASLGDDVAQTFKGGQVAATTLQQDLTLLRYSGGGSQPVGQFWTRTAYSSPGRAQQYLALPPGNTATTVTSIRVPSGTTIYQGRAAAQPQWSALGGGSQVYIPHVDPAWILP